MLKKRSMNVDAVLRAVEECDLGLLEREAASEGLHRAALRHALERDQGTVVARLLEGVRGLEALHSMRLEFLGRPVSPLQFCLRRQKSAILAVLEDEMRHLLLDMGEVLEQRPRGAPTSLFYGTVRGQQERVVLKLIDEEEFFLCGFLMRSVLQGVAPDHVTVPLGLHSMSGNRYLVMNEALGSLDRAVESARAAGLKQTPPGVAVDLLLQIVRGMEWLHRMGIVVGDMKCANVLVGRSDLKLRLADYGSPFAHTVSHTAPELLFCANEHPAPTRLSDVFAFGMTAFEILALSWPWQGSRDAIKRSIEEHQRPATAHLVPVALVQLIENCWAQDPSHRPQSATQVRLLLEQLGIAAEDASQFLRTYLT